MATNPSVLRDPRCTGGQWCRCTTPDGRLIVPPHPKNWAQCTRSGSCHHSDGHSGDCSYQPKPYVPTEENA